MAHRWVDPLRAVQPARDGHVGGGGGAVENALAGRARLATAQGRTGAGPLRRTFLARLPPPCHAVLSGLRLSGPRASAWPSDGAERGPSSRGGARQPFPRLAPSLELPRRRRVTLPRVRRALQRWLACPCPYACPLCKAQHAYTSGFT